MRRTIAAAATLALAVPALLSAAAPAVASSPCMVTALLPERLAIVRADQAVPLTVEDDGDCMDEAAYDLVGDDDAWVDGIVLEGPGTERLHLTEDAGPGAYRAAGDGGSDLLGDDLVAFDSSDMDARFASDVVLGLSRTGKRLRFELRVTRFSYDADAQTAWPGARVRLQRRQDGAWREVATATTDGRGAAVLKHSAGRGAWRAVVDDAPTTWGGTTSAIRL